MSRSIAQLEPAPAELRPELQQIIDSGRARPANGQGSLRSAAMLTAAGLGLLWLAFTPVEIGAAAWLAMVPLVQLVRLRTLPRRSLPMLWGLGVVWSLITLQWMRLGHPAMYTALLAMGVYLGLYLPAFVLLARRATRGGLPLWLAVPIVWTTLEYVRAWLLTGFSWYYLGHSQYRWSALTQISDLTGAWGVSFLVALGGTALAVQVPRGWLARIGLDVDDEAAVPERRMLPAVAALTACVAACIYGQVRLREPPPEEPGPVFALVQGNFSPDVKHDHTTINDRYMRHANLTFEARQFQPHFIVWPETMFPWPNPVVDDGVTDEELVATLPSEMRSRPGSDKQTLVSMWRSSRVQENLADQSRMVGAALVVGLETWRASESGVFQYNSAAFVRPDVGYVGRFDKMHLVLFGEYIPLKDVFPWLSSFTPFGSGFGLEPGESPQLFEYSGYTIAPLICFEDTVPHVVRQIARHRDEDGDSCDVLVNLTNDAWFRGSSELDQHLITSTFRCIESRRPMVRAVNGGISAFIDGNGRIREPDRMWLMADDSAAKSALTEVSGMVDPDTGRWRRQFNGLLLGQLPLDGRDSLYVRWGDWFCWLCALASVVAITLSVRRRA